MANLQNKGNISSVILKGYIIMGGLLAVLGILGLIGIFSISRNMEGIVNKRLPNIEALQTIETAMSDIYSAENILLCRILSDEDRTRTYKKFDEAFNRIKNARKIHDSLAQTHEEATTFKQFESAWIQWVADHNKAVELAKAYIENQNETTYAKYTDQALKANYISFSKADELLMKLIEMNTTAANGENTTAA